MADITLGRLTLRTYPIQILSDWQKIRKHAYDKLDLDFKEVGVWDCGADKWTLEPKPAITIKPRLQTFARSPMGRPYPNRRQAIEKRLKARSGISDKWDLAVSAMFPEVSFKTPMSSITQTIDKRYRTVVYYRVEHRFILCLPVGANPRDDYMVLSLPERVYWWTLRVGICGREAKREGSMGQEIHEFHLPGPYRRLNRNGRFRRVALSATEANTEFFQETPADSETAKWRETLRSDEELKRSAAKKTGTSTAMGYAWSIRFTPNHTLEDARQRAERARLQKKYG
ncbi:MAG: hypothetical protein AAF714_05530 [Pseudomonadota bacterium]